MMRRLLALLLFILALGLALPAVAHQTGRSTFVVHVKPEDRQIDTLLTCPLPDVAHGAQLYDARDQDLNLQDVQKRWNELGFYLDTKIDVENDGRPCRVVEHKQSPKNAPQSYWFLKAFECDGELGVVTIENAAMTETVGGYRHIGRIQLGEDVQTTVFNHETPTYDVHVSDPEPTSVSATIGRFIWEGILHIVLGIDHVLFVLGLILLSRRLKQLLVVVTAFTLSHSITLVLSALDVITLSAAVVEPIIALSIIFVAAEAVRNSEDGRIAYVATFLLGLLHGFGFSYVLRDEVGLPTDALVPALVSFNVGVELGQIGIIALLYPLRAWIRDRPWERKVVVGIACTIGVVALYWFVERTFIV